MKKFPAIFALLLLWTAGAHAQEEVSLDVGDGVVIRGTLLMPEGVPNPPVVLIIAGSGPTDRNGNNPQMQNNSLRYLAEGLQKEGVASLRYDKRMIAGSAYKGMREEDMTFESLADDARRLASMLYNDGRFSEIVLAGHSEGAAIAAIAAAGNPEISKVVSIAGAGRPWDKILTEQLERNPANPLPLIAEAKAIMENLRKGEPVKEVNPLLMPLFRPSVQPYVMSRMRHDPATDFAKLTVPAMIVQGGKDIQITTADMFGLLLAQPGARHLYIDDMNHVLKKTTATDTKGQMPTYATPAPNHEALAPAIAKFIKGE